MANPAKARRVRFDVQKVFAAEDPLTIPLLRLMMAVNDVGHLQRLIVVAQRRAKSLIGTPYEIANGEIGHLFRVLCGHLYEAGIAFRMLEDAAPGRLDTLVAPDPKMKVDLAEVRQAYDAKDRAGLKYSFLYPVRQYVGFHYKDEQLRTALSKYGPSGVLKGVTTFAIPVGLGRYTVADSLASLVIGESIDAFRDSDGMRNFIQRIDDVHRLANSMHWLVDCLLLSILAERPDCVLENREEEFEMPEGL